MENENNVTNVETNVDNNKVEESKKGGSKKLLIVVIIIILLGVVAALVVPSMLDKKEEPTKKEPDKENNEPIELPPENPGELDNDDTTEQGKEESGTDETTPVDQTEENTPGGDGYNSTELSDEQIISLLKFVPGTDNIVYSNNVNAYTAKSMNIYNVNKAALVAETMCKSENMKLIKISEKDFIKKFGSTHANNGVWDSYYGGYYYISLADLKTDLKKFYNVNLEDTNYNKEDLGGCGNTFVQLDNGYSYFAAAGSVGFLHKIEKSEITVGKLEITVVTAEYASQGVDVLFNPYEENSNKYYETKCDSSDIKCAQKYFENNLNKFGRYKHTFNINGSDFQWYSTEYLK